MMTEEQKRNYRTMTEDKIQDQFVYACEKNDVEKIKFFLEDPGFEYPLDVHFEDDLPLHWACHHKNMELIKYYHDSLYFQDNNALTKIFKDYCDSGSFDKAEYIFISFPIELADEVKEQINSDNSPKSDRLKQLLALTALNGKLGQDLPKNEDSQEKVGRMKL